MSKLRCATIQLLIVAAFIASWQLVLVAGLVDPMMLPTPMDVITRAWGMLGDQTVLGHLGITLLEVMLAVVLCVILANANDSRALAAWFQAIGSIIAIYVSLNLFFRQKRVDRQSAREENSLRESRSVVALSQVLYSAMKLLKDAEAAEDERMKNLDDWEKLIVGSLTKLHAEDSDTGSVGSGGKHFLTKIEHVFLWQEWFHFLKFISACLKGILSRGCQP